MVLVLKTVARPMVEVAFCRAGNQLPLWDNRLDYECGTLASRLLAAWSSRVRASIYALS